MWNDERTKKTPTNGNQSRKQITLGYFSIRQGYFKIRVPYWKKRTGYLGILLEYLLNHDFTALMDVDALLVGLLVELYTIDGVPSTASFRVIREIRGCYSRIVTHKGL